MKETTYVCCTDWEEHIPTINTLMTLATLRPSSPEYEGPPFRYCPYCGEYRGDDFDIKE